MGFQLALLTLTPDDLEPS